MSDLDLLMKALAPRRHTVLRLVYRALSGRPLTGLPGSPYLKPGERRWPGWKRQAYRFGVPAVTVAAVAYPRATAVTAAVLLVALAWAGSRRFRERRFTSTYVTPTLAAIRVPLAIESGVTLRVDPGLGGLVARCARPLSPAETGARHWYGERLEPFLRWLPDRAQRGAWALQRAAEPAVRPFRRPAPEWGPRIELRASVPYLTKEQRALVSSIVSSKIPVADTVEAWDQVGRTVIARWTVRKRPPAVVGYADVIGHLPRLAEWEFYVGQGAGDIPVTLSLKDDSPHLAVSAGSGAGKSVLAQLLAVQVLRRGGRVVILDRKGSHRWAIGQPGVDYCSRPAQMHAALVRLAELADERNTLAFHESDDWDCGPRHLVIAEELNATIGQLGNFWSEIREKGQVKKSPAIAALADLLFMGRSAKVNVLAVAQMLSARAIGGPEARENFGIRCLARYSSNAWKMLVPEAAMPRASRTLGRWQVVVGGQATETQVAYLNTAQARALANVPESPDSALTSGVTGNGDILLTLQDAVDAGVIPWSYPAAKQRLHRRVGAVPEVRGMKGRAHLYARADLDRWAQRADA